MKVLVTGASGRIGSQFVALRDAATFEVVRADTHDATSDRVEQFLRLDITDPSDCAEACRSMDAVLHLAADPSPVADFRSTVLPLNMVGTYNMVEAALATGVRRFVFASSAQAVVGYPLDHQARESDPPFPANDYGVGKAFGEALCAASSLRGPTTFVSVRIGHFREQRPGPDLSLRDRMAWLSPRDAVQILSLALTATIEGHAVVNAISDNAAKQLSLMQTRRLLGYEPVDDAFATGSLD